MGALKAPVLQASQHPNNVQPWGNYLFAQGKDVRNAGVKKAYLVFNVSMQPYQLCLSLWKHCFPCI